MTERVVVLTGAGISAESGLKTFRDSDGLWEGYAVTDVATPEAWQRDPELVQRFYNERRRSVREAAPNAAHRALVELESRYAVTVITQNIDDLHERAGSTEVLHLHGVITKSQSDRDSGLTYDIEGDEIQMGELCELGSQLRPHVVWFGEAVPMMTEACRVAAQADIFIIIGTSLVVYPAAGLVYNVPAEAPLFVIDPRRPEGILSESNQGRMTFIEARATDGVPGVVKNLLS